MGIVPDKMVVGVGGAASHVLSRAVKLLVLWSYWWELLVRGYSPWHLQSQPLIVISDSYACDESNPAPSVQGGKDKFARESGEGVW